MKSIGFLRKYEGHASSASCQERIGSFADVCTSWVQPGRQVVVRVQADASPPVSQLFSNELPIEIEAIAAA